MGWIKTYWATLKHYIWGMNIHYKLFQCSPGNIRVPQSGKLRPFLHRCSPVTDVPMAPGANKKGEQWSSWACLGSLRMRNSLKLMQKLDGCRCCWSYTNHPLIPKKKKTKGSIDAPAQCQNIVWRQAQTPPEISNLVASANPPREGSRQTATIHTERRWEISSWPLHPEIAGPGSFHAHLEPLAVTHDMFLDTWYKWILKLQQTLPQMTHCHPIISPKTIWIWINNNSRPGMRPIGA